MRRCPMLSAGVLSVAAFAACAPANADDRETCKTASGDPAITACSRAIASKKYKGNVLSILFTNRGAEYGAKGELDRAMKDHDQAIKIDPKNALAYNNRGVAKLKKGDKEGGEADIAKAKQLQPGVGQPQETVDAGAEVKPLAPHPAE
ncbi:MAG: tetratricopeptide repeat protein [Xanthobacteraceae bacterium]|nr:tetratricopeptide repeat protein [Xanthobacteraceae bacterium]